MDTVAFNITNNNNMQQQNDFFNYYLTMNINNICRICLEKGPRLMPIFDPVKPPHFPLLIMACAAVQVKILDNIPRHLKRIFQVLQGDGLPPYICQKCVSKLNIAFQFKSQCETSDAKLRQCFENFHHLPPTPDLSGFIELKKDDGCSLSIFQNDGTNNVEPSEIQIQSGELEASNILDSTGTQILVQMDSSASLYNIDQKTVVELKSEMQGIKTNLVTKVSINF